MSLAAAERSAPTAGGLRPFPAAPAARWVADDYRPELLAAIARLDALPKLAEEDVAGRYARHKAVERLEDAVILVGILRRENSPLDWSEYLYGGVQALSAKAAGPLIVPRASEGVMLWRARRLLALTLEDLRAVLEAVLDPAAGAALDDAARRLLGALGRVDRVHLLEKIPDLVRYARGSAGTSVKRLREGGPRGWLLKVSEAVDEGSYALALSLLPAEDDAVRVGRVGSWLRHYARQLRILLVSLVERRPATNGHVEAHLHLLQGCRYFGRSALKWEVARAPDGKFVKMRYADVWAEAPPGERLVAASAQFIQFVFP